MPASGHSGLRFRRRSRDVEQRIVNSLHCSFQLALPCCLKLVLIVGDTKNRCRGVEFAALSDHVWREAKGNAA